MLNRAKRAIATVIRTVPGARVAARIVNVRVSARRGTYPYYRELFIANGRTGRFDEKLRSSIVKRFEAIDRHVVSATTPTDGLVIAEGMLSMDVEGEIVECGCYAGASSAKLSILASILGKKLYIFDSFQGLPGGGEQVVHTRRKLESGKLWNAGDLSAGLDVVKRNVESFGEISACIFVEGWFSDTLNDDNLPNKIATAFTDVDLESSVRQCLIAIWPRLAQHGLFFSHDIAYVPALQALCDEQVWTIELKCFPPVLFGGGYGICDLAPHMGYLVKGDHLTPEHLKKFTLHK